MGAEAVKGLVARKPKLLKVISTRIRLLIESNKETFSPGLALSIDLRQRDLNGM